MIILQLTRDAPWNVRTKIRDDLYMEGKAGCMLLPQCVKLIAITDDDAENIEIISEDDEV